MDLQNHQRDAAALQENKRQGIQQFAQYFAGIAHWGRATGSDTLQTGANDLQHKDTEHTQVTGPSEWLQKRIDGINRESAFLHIFDTNQKNGALLVQQWGKDGQCTWFAQKLPNDHC